MPEMRMDASMELNVNNRTSFPMRGSRKFFQRGFNFDYVFLLLMMGEMIQIPI